MEEAKELKKWPIEILRLQPLHYTSGNKVSSNWESTLSHQWIKSALLKSSNWENHVQEEDQVYLGWVRAKNVMRWLYLFLNGKQAQLRKAFFTNLQVSMISTDLSHQ